MPDASGGYGTRERHRLGINYRVGVLSSPWTRPANAANWTSATSCQRPRLECGDMGAWLEGNAVVTPAGELVDVLRGKPGRPTKAHRAHLPGRQDRSFIATGS